MPLIKRNVAVNGTSIYNAITSLDAAQVDQIKDSLSISGISRTTVPILDNGNENIVGQADTIDGGSDDS